MMKASAQIAIVLLVATLGAAADSTCPPATDCDTKDTQVLLQSRVSVGKMEDEDIDSSVEQQATTQAPVLCDFELSGPTYCQMWTNGMGDPGVQFDWTQDSSTPSGHTGPSASTAHGKFLFIETSVPRQTGDNATLKSNPVTFGSAAKLDFDFHMKGDSIGKLEIFVKVGGSSDSTPVWERGKTDVDPNWQTGSVDLSSYQHETGTVEFVGERGTDWQGDIALDNILLDTGSQGPSATTQTPTQAPATTQPPATTTQALSTQPATTQPPALTQAPSTQPPATTQPPSPTTQPSPATTAPATTPPPGTVDDELLKLGIQVTAAMQTMQTEVQDMETRLDADLTSLETKIQQINVLV